MTFKYHGKTYKARPWLENLLEGSILVLIITLFFAFYCLVA